MGDKVKKLRKALLYMFERDGFKERCIERTKSGGVAVNDFLNCEHFKKQEFTSDDFKVAFAVNNQDPKLKEENHFLLVEEDNGPVVKFFADGIDYEQSESEEKKESLSTEKNSVENDKNHVKPNEDADSVDEERIEESASSGQKKKSKKKNKSKNKNSNDALVQKNVPVKDVESSGSSAKGNENSAASSAVPVKGKTVKEKNVPDKNQKQPEVNKEVAKTELSKGTEQECQSPELTNDEVNADPASCDSELVSSSSADGFSPAASKKQSKKKEKQSKGAGKQSETNETKSSAKESKQQTEGKQSTNEMTKKEEKQDKNAKEAKASSKANAPTEKTSENKTAKQTNELKRKEIKPGSEPMSSDEEKSSESHTEPGNKKQKKKKASEDPGKMLKVFEFLFTKEGLKEKKIAVGEDGFVKVKSIVEAFSNQYVWTEEQIHEVLRGNPFYLLKKDDTHGLLVKYIDKPLVSDQGSNKMETSVENNEWKETGRKEAVSNRKNEDGAFGGRPRTDAGQSRPGRGGFIPPDKICSTLFWVLKEGAMKHNIPFQPGNSLLIEDILRGIPNFSNSSESDLIAAVKADDRNSIVLGDHNGRPTIRKNESRGPPRDRYMDPSKKSDFHLSKTMSFLLRHGAEKLRLPMHPDGFIFVDDLLKYNDLKIYNESDVQRVVAENDKKRFFLAKDSQTGRLKVRANQGHTIEVPDLDLEEITNAKDFPTVIHGTYKQAWNAIKSQGLKCMGRNHIHFAAGEPGADGVISGMRGSCDILIYIDLEKALKDGIKFFRSANNVILTPGDKQGVLSPVYFASAFQRNPRMKLPL